MVKNPTAVPHVKRHFILQVTEQNISKFICERNNLIDFLHLNLWEKYFYSIKWPNFDNVLMKNHFFILLSCWCPLFYKNWVNVIIGGLRDNNTPFLIWHPIIFIIFVWSGVKNRAPRPNFNNAFNKRLL